MLRRAPLGRGLAGRPFALHILHEPCFLYVVLDDGPARPAVALVAAGHLPREVRRREVHDLEAARVRPQSVVAPDALAPVDAFAIPLEITPLVRAEAAAAPGLRDVVVDRRAATISGRDATSRSTAACTTSPSSSNARSTRIITRFTRTRRVYFKSCIMKRRAKSSSVSRATRAIAISSTYSSSSSSGSGALAKTARGSDARSASRGTRPRPGGSDPRLGSKFMLLVQQ